MDDHRDLEDNWVDIPLDSDQVQNEYLNLTEGIAVEIGRWYVFLNLIELILMLHFFRKYIDDRTCHDHILKQMAAWEVQYETLVDAYLHYEANGALPLPSTSETLVGQSSVELLAINFLRESFYLIIFFIFIGFLDNEFIQFPTGSNINEALIRHGYLGNAPYTPSIAISLDVLCFYKAASTRCPQFSLQAITQTLCDLHFVRYTFNYY
jgi:hypothetical protein